jgi:hypothetical protein
MNIFDLSSGDGSDRARDFFNTRAKSLSVMYMKYAPFNGQSSVTSDFTQICMNYGCLNRYAVSFKYTRKRRSLLCSDISRLPQLT